MPPRKAKTCANMYQTSESNAHTKWFYLFFLFVSSAVVSRQNSLLFALVSHFSLWPMFVLGFVGALQMFTRAINTPSSRTHAFDTCSLHLFSLRSFIFPFFLFFYNVDKRDYLFFWNTGIAKLSKQWKRKINVLLKIDGMSNDCHKRVEFAIFAFR